MLGPSNINYKSFKINLNDEFKKSLKWEHICRDIWLKLYLVPLKYIYILQDLLNQFYMVVSLLGGAPKQKFLCECDKCPLVNDIVAIEKKNEFINGQINVIRHNSII